MKRYINKTIILTVILLAGFSGLAKAQNKTQAVNLETVLKLGGAKTHTTNTLLSLTTFAVIVTTGTSNNMLP